MQKSSEVENLQRQQTMLRRTNSRAETEAKSVGEYAREVAARNARLAADRGIDPERMAQEAAQKAAGEALTNLPQRLAAAGVPPRYRHHRLADFRAWLSADDPTWKGGGYCLRGPTGNGKSSLAGALVSERMTREPGLIVQWVPILDFVMRVKSAAHPQSGERPYDLLKKLKTAKLVVFDDLGKERGHDWDKEILTAALWQSWDYEQDLIITTNLGLSEINKEHPALASRLGSLREVALGKDDLRFQPAGGVRSKP